MKINISKLRVVAAFGLFIPINGAVALIPSTSPAQDQKGAAKKESIFPDKNLEKAVRRAVYAKRNNNEPITADDVKSISTISGRGLGISDLTGLEHCRALGSLELPGNQITDLKPIGGLERVQLLDLSNNQVEDISPVAGMKGLQYLNIENNRVSSVGALETLENLNSLYAEGNRISDIQPLGNLRKLWTLNLKNNRVVSLEGIAKLKRVDSFDLSGNQIADLGPFLQLFSEKGKGDARFTRVYLAGNPLDSPGAKVQLEELRKLGLQIRDLPTKKE